MYLFFIFSYKNKNKNYYPVLEEQVSINYAQYKIKCLNIDQNNLLKLFSLSYFFATPNIILF